MITTITIPKNIKEELEKLKGSKTWSEFLEELIKVYKEYLKEQKRKAIEKLMKILEEDKKWKSVEEFLEERKKAKWFRY